MMVSEASRRGEARARREAARAAFWRLAAARDLAVRVRVVVAVVRRWVRSERWRERRSRVWRGGVRRLMLWGNLLTFSVFFFCEKGFFYLSSNDALVPACTALRTGSVMRT